MAWSASAMFVEWAIMTQKKSGTTWGGIEADTIKAALFNNSVTPDKDAAVGSTGFNTGTWTTGNEVTDSDGSSDWVSGGIALGSDAVTDQGSGVVMYDAADTTHSNTVTLTNAYGCLVYDDTITAGTVADQGITYHYFGGAQSVTAGTFTIVWHANGLFRITV